MDFVCTVALLLPAWVAAAPTTAFYHGPHLPVTAIAAFDRVVVEPDHTTADELRALAEAGVEVFARLDVGEAAEHRPWFVTVDPAWKLGKTTPHRTALMDPAQAGWRQLLSEQARSLHARGYQGLLLGALDGYEAVLPSEAERSKRAEALLGWLADLRRELPACKLLFERGFALFPRAHAFASGLVVDSLFAGWDAGSAAATGKCRRASAKLCWPGWARCGRSTGCRSP